MPGRGAAQAEKRRLLLALQAQHFFAQTHEWLLGVVVGPGLEIVDGALAAVKNQIEIHWHAVGKRELDRLGILLALVFAV